MILYFSATGNSRYVAQMLSEKLADRRLVDLREFFNGGKPVLEAGRGEKIGFVFPVHSWGMPKRLYGIIASLKIHGYDMLDNFCYMVCTCGDDAGLTAKQWRSAIAAAGIQGDASYSVFMPNTYVLLPGFDVDSPEVEARKLSEAPAKVAAIANHIAAGETGDFTHHGSCSFLKSKVVYPLFMACMTDRPFRVSDACISCGACAKSCPTANISMSLSGRNNHDDIGVKPRPQWHHHCINCLACYHACPSSAITYIPFATSKSRYRLPSSLCK